MPIDSTFESDFDVTEIPETDTHHEIFRFPIESKSGQDGLLLLITPRGQKPWVGLFAKGDIGGLSGAYHLPNRDRLLVVSNGQGFLVSAMSPEKSKRLDMSAIKQAMPDLQSKRLFLADDQRVMSLGENDIEWENNRVGKDGIKIGAVENGYLHLQVWGPPDNQKRVRLDIHNGQEA